MKCCFALLWLLSCSFIYLFITPPRARELSLVGEAACGHIVSDQVSKCS